MPLLRAPAQGSRKLLKSPGSLKTLDCRDAGLEILTHRRARTPWLACIPLGIIAALPLVVEGPLTHERALAALVLGAVVIGLLVWSRPRTIRQPLVIDGTRLRLAEITLDLESLELTGAREDWPNSTPVYRLTARACNGQRETLLEGPDPARVLTEARELSRRSGLKLSGRWGAGDSQAGRPRVAAPLRVKGPTLVSQRSAGYTALGSSLFVLGFFLMMVNSRMTAGLSSSALSLLLPLPAVLYGLGLSLWLLGAHATVAFVPRVGLTYTRSWLGFAFDSEIVREEDLLGVEAAAPDGGEPLHLLVDSTKGVHAWPLVGAAAEQVARAFRKGPPGASAPPICSSPSKRSPSRAPDRCETSAERFGVPNGAAAEGPHVSSE